MLQVDRSRTDVDDVGQADAAEPLSHRDQGLTLLGVGLGVDDQDGAGPLGAVLGEGRGAADGGGDAQAGEVDTVPGTFGHLPGHHGAIADDEDLGVREAGAGEDVGIAGFEVVTPDLRSGLAGQGDGGGREDAAEGNHQGRRMGRDSSAGVDSTGGSGRMGRSVDFDY